MDKIKAYYVTDSGDREVITDISSDLSQAIHNQIIENVKVANKRLADSRRVKTFLTKYKDRVFIYYQDPGHGWLAVPRELVVELGIKVSSFSYQSKSGAIVYLEEDCDASNFVVEYKKVFGKGPSITERHTKNNRQSVIRSLKQYEGL